MNSKKECPTCFPTCFPKILATFLAALSRAHTRPLLALWLTLFSLSSLSACKTSPESSSVSEIRQHLSPSHLFLDPSWASLCKKASCRPFCQASACLFESQEACLKNCERQCGDGYFESMEEEHMRCLENDLSCENAKRCCEKFPSSPLCPKPQKPERPQEGKPQ